MKVKFTKLKDIHLEMVRNWRNTDEVSKYMYTDHYISKDEHLSWFNRVKKDPTKIYWMIEVNGAYVGVVNLYDISTLNKRCYWAYYIADPTVRGKGLGRIIELNILNYVFEELELNKLCCEVLSFNEIVVKIHQKYGSKIEGKFRQHIFKNGKFYDIFCMGILKEDWINLKEQFEFEKIEIE
ncbi:MAG: UDP-4-amino-4,6-dideoxy-N-acetyl-beta-L-altrosamine N-acetyltransferase [Candidatus Odinarchaeota archaeon]